MTPSEANAPVLKLQDIHKTFSGITAIENFSLEVYPGEIVALVGDKSAGGQFPHQGFIDRCIGEVEVVEVFCQR